MAASADPKSHQVYAFGPFRLDPQKELLLREDKTVPVAPKALRSCWFSFATASRSSPKTT